MSANGKQTYNFFSQNTQGHRGDVHTSVISQMNAGKTQIAVLQESGTPNVSLTKVPGQKNLSTGTIESDSKRKTRSSGKKVHALHYEFKGSKDGNARTSMTMLSAEQPKKSGIIKSRQKGIRPMMYMQFDNFTVTNVHLPSGKPAFAAKVMHGFLEDLDDELGGSPKKKMKTQNAPPPVLILGDLNMDNRRAKNTATQHSFNTSSPSMATHQSGSTLDHVLSRGGTVSNVNTQFTSSDHGNVKGVFEV